jgi:hypothetical protein
VDGVEHLSEKVFVFKEDLPSRSRGCLPIRILETAAETNGDIQRAAVVLVFGARPNGRETAGHSIAFDALKSNRHATIECRTAPDVLQNYTRESVTGSAVGRRSLGLEEGIPACRINAASGS